MINFHRFKRLDIRISQYILSLIRTQNKLSMRKTLILTFSQGELNGVEDRINTYFKMLSKAEMEGTVYFRILTLRRFIPATFYSIIVLLYCARFRVSLLMIDHNLATRIPTVSSLEELSRKLPVCFVWFETFELENVLRRIKPFLFPKSIHIVTDDPQLRIRKIPDLYQHVHLFRFFPAPFIPKALFYSSDFDSRQHEVSFFGAVDDSLGHRERRFYLDSLSPKWKINGFFASTHEKSSRPSYLKMMKDLQNSKIVLNFSNHGGIGALTNRVTETIACGAVLFSTPEKVLSDFLIPGIHYIKFENLSQLENSLLDMTSSSERLKSISTAAQELYLKQFTAEHFLSLLRSENFIV